MFSQQLVTANNSLHFLHLQAFKKKKGQPEMRNSAPDIQKQTHCCTVVHVPLNGAESVGLKKRGKEQSEKTRRRLHALVNSPNVITTCWKVNKSLTRQFDFRAIKVVRFWDWSRSAALKQG